MEVTLSGLARHVAPGDAMDWWFDFREGATDHRFLGVPVRRRILARSPEEVEMEDRAPLFREQTLAWREANAVRFEGTNTFSSFRGAYRFEAEGAHTRITLEATIDLRRPLRLGAPLAPPVARALLRRDLEGHARELEADRSTPAPSR